MTITCSIFCFLIPYSQTDGQHTWLHNAKFNYTLLQPFWAAIRIPTSSSHRMSPERQKIVGVRLRPFLAKCHLYIAFFLVCLLASITAIPYCKYFVRSEKWPLLVLMTTISSLPLISHLATLAFNKTGLANPSSSQIYWLLIWLLNLTVANTCRDTHCLFMIAATWQLSQFIVMYLFSYFNRPILVFYSFL